MDLFGLETKRENQALKDAIKHEHRAQYNYALIMNAKNMERLLAAIIATVLFSQCFKLL